MNVLDNFFSKRERIICLILFLLLWTYVFLKAILSGVFCDELITYYFNVQTGLIFTANYHFDANNHFLNSQLTLWSYQIFGSSPLVLRLPNVLFFAIYFFSTYKIGGLIKASLLRWTFLLSITMCGFIFEYFAMSRGYGLSMALMMLGIWVMMSYIKSGKILHLILMCVFLWLAVFANLTILISSLFIFLFVFVIITQKDFKINRKKWLIHSALLVVLGIPFLHHADHALKMKEAGILIYGSLDGIYSVTVRSLSAHTFGVFNDLIGYTVVTLFIGLIIFFIYQLYKTKKVQFLFSNGGFFLYQILLSIVIVYILGRFFEINYPQDRVAMNLLIFMIGAITFTLAALHEKIKWSKYLGIILLVIPAKFIVDFNPYDTQNWRSWRHSDRIYDKVASFESNFKFPVIISAWIPQEMPFYYASHQNGYELGGPQTNSFPALEADVILQGPADTNWVTPMIDHFFDTAYVDPYTDVIVFKRKQFLEKELLASFDIEDITDSQDNYFSLATIESDSLNGQSLYFGVEMTLDAEAAPFRSRIVVCADQSSNPEYQYNDYQQLEWLRPSYDGQKGNVRYGAMLPNIPEDATKVYCYLWNIYGTPFSIKDGKCYVYRIKKDY